MAALKFWSHVYCKTLKLHKLPGSWNNLLQRSSLQLTLPELCGLKKQKPHFPYRVSLCLDRKYKKILIQPSTFVETKNGNLCMHKMGSTSFGLQKLHLARHWCITCINCNINCNFNNINFKMLIINMEYVYIWMRRITSKILRAESLVRSKNW